MKIVIGIILACHIAAANAAQPTSFVVDSQFSFAATVNNVKQAAMSNNFRVVREQDLSVKGVKVHAIWFCNFEVLNKAIHKHKQVGYLLPFRVTVVEHNGKVSVSSSNPDRSMKLIRSKLGNLCDVIRASYKTILAEASL